MKKIAYIVLVVVATMFSGCTKVLTRKILTLTLPAKVEPFSETVFFTPKDSSEYDGFQNYQSILVFVNNKGKRKKVEKKEVIKVVALPSFIFVPNETIVITSGEKQYRQFKKIARLKGRRKVKKFFKNTYVPVFEEKVSGNKNKK